MFWEAVNTASVESGNCVPDLWRHSSGVEYVVAGHSDRKQGRLLVNMKSFVKPWKASLARKVLTLLKKDCNW